MEYYKGYLLTIFYSMMINKVIDDHIFTAPAMALFSLTLVFDFVSG